MNADAFRQLYDYHFAENRTLWAYIEQLSEEQFRQAVPYSIGSVHDQAVHLMQVDEAWFSDLRHAEHPAEQALPDRAAIRLYWDGVEQSMREYLATVQDAQLVQKPFSEGEDKDLLLWQVLLHVVNHGTDHRAQILRIIHDFGVQTTSQDYIFYAYAH